MTGFRAGLAVLATLFAFASVAAFAMSVRDLARLRRRARWRRVDGRILDLRLEPRGESGLLLHLVHESEGVRSTKSDLDGQERRLTERERLRERFAIDSTHAVLVAPTGERELVTGLSPWPLSGVVVGLGLLAPAGLFAAAAWWLG